MHKRRALLEDIKSQLETLDGFGGVWIQRNAPSRNMYPAITLYCEVETAERQTINTVMCLARKATIKIVCWIRSTQDDEKIESDFDECSEVIEKILSTPAGADDLFLIGSDFQYVEDDAEINALSLTYMLEYSALERSPSV